MLDLRVARLSEQVISCTTEMVKTDTCAELSVWGLTMLRAMHHMTRRSDTMGILHHCQVNSCWIDNEHAGYTGPSASSQLWLQQCSKYVHWTVMLA